MIMSSLHIGPRELVKTVVLENERKEEELQTSLEHLDKNFSVLMIAIRSALDHKLQHQQLVLVDFIRWIEHRMNWVGELSNVMDLNELLKKLHPYFDFLDCGLIVDMSEQFLNDECFGDKDLVGQLKKHKVKCKNLRSSSTVKQLRDDLKKIYFPHHTNPSNMPQIYIALNSTWDEVNIKQLYLLIGHLLPHKSKQSILKHIEIHAGSVIIKYIVNESSAECLIAYAQSKLQFMRLVGIFGLIINGERILKEDENMNFTFKLALLQAANVGHYEAVQFLLKLGDNVNVKDIKGQTALMIASQKGHMQVIECLLKEHADVNIQTNDGWTALMIASHYAHTQLIEQLLKENADINTQTNNGWTALMLASENGHTQVVEQLLKEYADVNLQDKEGVTALMLASENGHTQVVEQLLKENTDINTQTNDGWTALMIASQNRHIEVVEQLLKEHADVNLQNKEGTSSLILASQSGHTQVVEQLLKEYADVNLQNKEGTSSLILASENGHTQVVEQLLKENADVNLQNKEDMAALMLASENGHTQVVEQLLKEYADVNLQDKEGMTALMLASENGHTQVVEQLLKEYADVNLQDKEGVTALMLASQNGHTQVVKQLLKENADINTQTNDGWTALMLASQNCHIEVVEQLLKEHADVNLQNKEGTTSLMLASQSGHTQVVEQLLKEHAVVNRQHKEGVTALMLASRNDHIKVVEQLLKEDADVNIQNKKGVTALMLASENGHTEVVEAIVKELVDIDVKMRGGGYTALMLASIKGHVEVADCLLQSFADPHIIAYNGLTAFSLAAFNGNRDLVHIILDKGEPTTDEIEKAVITSCYGGHPSLITILSNKLTHLTVDQKELLDSCVKGDVDAVIRKTLDSSDLDTPLVLGLTPLMVASSCGHVDIVDVLIQAGANVNKQESHFGFTPLFFAVQSSKSSLITETLLMYGAHPNIIADNNTPLDIAIDIKEETISKILINYGGQTRSQLHRKKQSEFSELLSSLPTLRQEVMTKSLLTIDDITMYEVSSYTLKKEVKVESLEKQSFTSLNKPMT